MPALAPLLKPVRLLYTRKESAAMLAISIRKLDDYIASGELKVRRLGGNVLIHYDTLVAFASEDRGVPKTIVRNSEMHRAA